ncbi:MAG: hypothetical protein K6T94_22610 [Paenibacillus sp.]|nr:hypothetical protein [Paenibacillus sp.]
MKNSIPWTQIVTAVVAIYAAIVSTITLITNRREKIRRLKIIASNGVIGNSIIGASELMLLITVSNPGHKNVVINAPYLRLPNKNKLIFPNPGTDVRYPHKLEESSACTLWSDMEQLKDVLRSQGLDGIIKLRAEVTDGSQRIYRAKKTFKLNLSIR